jgi:hypothetical protein
MYGPEKFAGRRDVNPNLLAAIARRSPEHFLQKPLFASTPCAGRQWRPQFRQRGRLTAWLLDFPLMGTPYTLWTEQ